MKRKTFPALLLVATMLLLTACANKRTEPADMGGHTEGAGGTMGM